MRRRRKTKGPWHDHDPVQRCGVRRHRDPDRLKEISAAHDLLRAEAATLTEEGAREAIELPGWTGDMY
ncbi:hypothetical protein OG596_20435 [Streptomyces sp. NBC_01102]|uniref:hypothetical protein n=1 Tax=unclassified Streptomyces TaxID=2593676 RepID=UPI00386A992A|nr:hypothetical protein OG596_20435 [Streptomyces sp. NBC_01102]